MVARIAGAATVTSVTHGMRTIIMDILRTPVNLMVTTVNVADDTTAMCSRVPARCMHRRGDRGSTWRLFARKTDTGTARIATDASALSSSSIPPTFRA